MATPEKINSVKYMKYNADGNDGQHVKAGFWNNLVTWLLAMFPALGSANINTISEYTSGSGVTVDDVLIKDGSIKIDTVTEKTSGSGVAIDGLTIKDGKAGATTAVTANATGGNTAILGAFEQVAVITSAHVDHIVSLPLLASVPTGAHIQGVILNTGCELRPHPTNKVTLVTVNGVSATGGTEIALGNTAGKYFDAVKVGALRWIVSTVSSTGANRISVPN